VFVSTHSLSAVLLEPHLFCVVHIITVVLLKPVIVRFIILGQSCSFYSEFSVLVFDRPKASY